MKGGHRITRIRSATEVRLPVCQHRSCRFLITVDFDCVSVRCALKKKKQLNISSTTANTLLSDTSAEVCCRVGEDSDPFGLGPNKGEDALNVRLVGNLYSLRSVALTDAAGVITGDIDMTAVEKLPTSLGSQKVVSPQQAHDPAE